MVFEAGLFGGALGIQHTFILHAERFEAAERPARADLRPLRPGHQPGGSWRDQPELREAIETEGRRSLVEGLWWQLSLTMRSEEEPSAGSALLRISRDRDGGLNMTGRAWQEDGTLSARYWSEAAKERRDPAGIFYFWKGERPRHPDAPQLEGTGEIKVETADRATGYWTTQSDRDPRAECPNRRRLPSSRPFRPPAAGRRQRGGAGRPHRAAPPGVEVGRERILNTDRAPKPRS